MIKAVIFDLDNTLVNFMEVKRRAVEAAAASMVDAGLRHSKQETIDRIFNMYDREGIEDQRVFDKLLAEEYGGIDFRILAAGVVGYRKAKEGNMVLYPHVRTTIAHLLKRGIKLAIVSDAPRMSAWTRLVILGLDSFFDVVVTHEDTGERKPHPAPFRMAMDRLGVTVEESIMVGDWAEKDIVGAKALKMKTVFARYGDDFNTKESGADFEVNDVFELVKIVDRLNGLPEGAGESENHG